MGDETWASIQLVKNNREKFREKLKRRKAERDTILSVTSGGASPSHLPKPYSKSIPAVVKESDGKLDDFSLKKNNREKCPPYSAEQEKALMLVLSDCIPPIAIEKLQENSCLKKHFSCIAPLDNSVGAESTCDTTLFNNLLQKLACRDLICINEVTRVVTSIQHNQISASLDHNKQKIQKYGETICKTTSETREDTPLDEEDSNNHFSHIKVEENINCNSDNISSGTNHGKRKTEDEANGVNKSVKKDDLPENCDDVMSLLSAQSCRERENKRVGEEILELLNKPTAKEKSLAQHFRSQGGAKVREFCPRGTSEECIKSKGRLADGTASAKAISCGKLHFRKIIQPHTDESLGDCSFLNTCFHMDTCRYVHYEVDYSGMEEVTESNNFESTQPINKNSTVGSSSSISSPQKPNKGMLSPRRGHDRTVLLPAQWIQCDLRYLDMSILGKFSVIMADPPWDIHMELPYGTMSDDEMRQLNIPALQDEGLIFLWVTGRAMELGRECLTLWGYERVDEIIWVKTNQLQRIIRTGRTGHWLNHGKEHCLVGMKGKPKINRCMDCDVIVAEVRATSHKPDEIYGIIERLSPGTRKIELFGRHHNVQPNWLTLGNQLEGVNLMEEELRKFYEHYPDGICGKR